MRQIITTIAGAGLIAALPLLAPTPEARGQAIGFQPTVSPFADGVFLNAAPVVTADRRYVRLGGINANAQALQGVQPFAFTGGAVAGGGVANVIGLGGASLVGPVGGVGLVSPLGGVGFGNVTVAGTRGTVGGLGRFVPLGTTLSVGNVGVVQGFGPMGPFGVFSLGWPGGFYGAYPYGVMGVPAGPIVTGPMWMPPQTINALGPTGVSIMNAVAPGSWRYGGW